MPAKALVARAVATDKDAREQVRLEEYQSLQGIFADGQ